MADFWPFWRWSTMTHKRAPHSLLTSHEGYVRMASANGAFAAFALLLAACSGTNHGAPAPVEQVDPQPRNDASVNVDPCAKPGHIGCPCEEKSVSVECGK